MGLKVLNGRIFQIEYENIIRVKKVGETLLVRAYNPRVSDAR